MVKTKNEKTAAALELEALQAPENKRNFMNDQVFKFVFGKKQRKAIAIDFITCAVKPVPSGGGYKAPRLLCSKLRTIVVSSRS